MPPRSLHVVGPPDLLTVGRETDELAALAKDVEPIAVRGRGGARTGGQEHEPESAAAPDLGLPDLLAVRLVEGKQAGRAVTIACGVDATAADGDAAHPLTDALRLPRQRRAIL